MYRIHADIRLGRLYAEGRGFWGNDVSRDYRQGVSEAFRSLARYHSRIEIFADFGAFAPQGQSQIDFHLDHSEERSLLTVTRHALVTSSALVRLQLKRALNDFGATHFDDVPSALAWLGWDSTELDRLRDQCPWLPASCPEAQDWRRLRE
ncbi:hypothetical protein [Sphingomonas sp.]|uniref:hypothetical protein n=1 Tax=Sphingomonas sp. TaxID=28214 RepID=UPI000DB6CDEC|nr:hypothetical protein [Sphingomonas sp.]PZU06736.1 MAG: hypothetical protein DI605_18085 [Sphingomonas sp.]